LSGNLADLRHAPRRGFDLFAEDRLDRIDDDEIRAQLVRLGDDGLEIRLAQLLGRAPNIWRDTKKLRGNLEFQDQINDDLAKVTVFVSVLSPRYLESASCRAEVAAFTRAAEQQGGIRRGNTHRVFKVIKTEIPREAHPAGWQSLLGYEFYEKDRITDRVREFDHLLIGNQRDKRYWDKLEDLADDITKALHTLPTTTTPPTYSLLDLQQSGSPKPIVSSGLTVYLAETTSDLTTERDNLKRELQQRGHRVLPDQTLSLNVTELTQAVREYLRQAMLSVHLLGARYGMVPETEDRSLPHIQLDLAAERCGQPNFARLLWIPPGLPLADERQRQRQQQLIDIMQQTSHIRSELQQTELEDLKNHILTKLSAPFSRDTNGHQEQEIPKVYLVCDQRDGDATKPLDDFLFNSGFEVWHLPFGNDGTPSLQSHKENLQQCDAVLIYYGQADSSWASTKLRDLSKLPGYRRRPLMAKAIYLAAPPTNEKERLYYSDLVVIRGYAGFSSDGLAPFLAQIKQSHRVGS